MDETTSPLQEGRKEPIQEAVVVGLVADTFIGSKGFDAFQCHGATDDWKIIGEDMQVLSIKMPPNSKKMTEPGTFFMSTEDITLSTTCDGCCAKCCTGENPVTTVLENEGSEEGYIGLTANYPAQILPINLDEVSGGIIAAKGAYMTSDQGVETSCNLDFNPTTACCAGLGCVRQGLSGQGDVFLNAGGSVMKKTLQDGETMVVSTQGLVAWTSDVSLGVQPTGGCCMCCLSGEGCCNTTTTGPGTVYIASMPLSKMKASLGTSVTVQKKKAVGGAPSSGEIER